MMLTVFRRRRVLSSFAIPVVAALVAGLVGCASTPTPENEREALLQRAGAYWKTALEADPTAAWPYEELSKKPGWTLQAYMKREGILYEAAQVLNVRSLEGDRAVVDVKIVYSVPLLRMSSQEVLLQDEWVRLEGLWYHADKKSIL